MIYAFATPRVEGKSKNHDVGQFTLESSAHGETLIEEMLNIYLRDSFSRILSAVPFILKRESSFAITSLTS
jgi:hypothetical protein